MSSVALCAVLAVLLSACSTGGLRRDVDLSGELPRALGLGAFAPACVMLCFVSNDIRQGNVEREEIESEPLRVRSKSQAGGK